MVPLSRGNLKTNSFNCMLPAFQCKNGGKCDQSNGQCECPSGFGSQDCSEPVCESPLSGHKRQVRNGTSCDCTSGWQGINCNMCESDQACAPLLPPEVSQGAVCYKGGELVTRNDQLCNVTNRKILEMLKGKLPRITYSCNRTASDCNFQFWIDNIESFYCALDDCRFDRQVPMQTETDKKKYQYECSKVQCSCIPGRMLCGEKGSIDITDFLSETIKGPGTYTCDKDTGLCEFSEPSMNDLILNVFGDQHISLSCISAECLHYSQVPDRIPAPTQPTVGRLHSLGVLIAATLLPLLLAAIARYVYNSKTLQQSSILYESVALPREDDAFAQVIAKQDPVTLSFENIGYTIDQPDNTQKNLLHGKIIGAVRPGEILAILGGSGAGKTTLLEILAHKKKRGKVHGSVYVNGHTLSPKEFGMVSGFVEQEECLTPTLTVYETILFSALLRMPRNVSKAAKKLRVLETMEQLGLYSVKDMLIGGPAKRSISGGEKRRVAIACELVTSPSVLFLDEPTSGLDSYSAHAVIESIVRLARDYKRTIVLTIHQPKSSIMSLFSHVALLAKGELVYLGPQSLTAQYFSDLGFSCPQNYNLADYLIDLTMSPSFAPTQSVPDSNSAVTHNTDLCDPYQNASSSGSLAENVSSEWLHFASHRQELRPPKRHVSSTSDGLAKEFRDSSLAKELEDTLQELKVQRGDLRKGISSWERVGILEQFLILAERTFKNLYRDPLLLATHYAMAVALALICGVLYSDIGNDISGFQNRLGLFFFILALFGFSTLTTLGVFGQERLTFLRERASGYYRPLAYYTAKVLFDILPLRVLPPILMGMILYPLVGLTQADHAEFKFILTLILFNLAAASICLVIGILVSDVSVANLIGSLVMLFSLLFAGLFLNHGSMPETTAWIRYLSIFHYAYEALTVNEVRYLTLIEKKYGLSIEVPGATILSTFGFDVGAFTKDIVGLATMFLLLLAFGYASLNYVLIEKR